MTQNATIIVEGQVQFVGMSSSIPHATMYVQLVDVTLADAPSTVIAEEVIHNVSIDVESPHAVPFSIRAPSLNERAMYTLMVHVDVSRSGRITLGDYLTMESFPVSLIDSPVFINVQVCLVQ